MQPKNLCPLFLRDHGSTPSSSPPWRSRWEPRCSRSRRRATGAPSSCPMRQRPMAHRATRSRCSDFRHFMMFSFVHDAALCRLRAPRSARRRPLRHRVMRHFLRCKLGQAHRGSLSVPLRSHRVQNPSAPAPLVARSRSPLPASTLRIAARIAAKPLAPIAAPAQAHLRVAARTLKQPIGFLHPTSKTTPFSGHDAAFRATLQVSLGCIGTLSEGSELQLRAFDLCGRRSYEAALVSAQSLGERTRLSSGEVHPI